MKLEKYTDEAGPTQKRSFTSAPPPLVEQQQKIRTPLEERGLLSSKEPPYVLQKYFGERRNSAHFKVHTLSEHRTFADKPLSRSQDHSR